MDVRFIEDNELLETYIWNRVEKDLGCEPIYNQKFLKIKIRSYGNEATDFHDKEVPKVVSSYTFLAVISLDSVLKKGWKLLSTRDFTIM